MSDAQALTILMRSPVTQQMIQHIVNATLKVIKCKKSTTTTKHGPPSPAGSPNGKSQRQIPSLMTFISKLVRYTNVFSGTLLSTLVYLEKLSFKLPKSAEGLPCTLHRIFLASLIISAKFNNDSSPKNCHWADYTDGLFTLKDVNLMERQMLNLLNWDVQVTTDDLSRCLRNFIEPIKHDLKNVQRLRRSLPKSKSIPSALSSPQASPRPPLQTPPVSPVSYKDIMQYKTNTHYRSSSVSSLSSTHSQSSSSSGSSSSSQSEISGKVGLAEPVYLYQPLLQKNMIQPAYSYSFDHRELESYVSAL